MNPHEILGVKGDASKDEIKKAYRKLAKDSHPDKNNGDDTKFKKITHAYEVLTNPKARRDYERDQANKTRSNPFSRQNVHPTVDDILKDFMNSNFNPGQSRPRYNTTKQYNTKIKKKTHGKHINLVLNLILEDAFHGKIVEIRVDRLERTNQEKREKKTKKIKITIPKGARHEQQLVLGGQGNQGLFGGMDGDILVMLNIRPHAYFKRENDNLYSTIKIPFTQLILGDNVKFKNIDGEIINVPIHENCKGRDIIEIKDKGMPVGGSKDRGCLKFLIEVEMPDSMSDSHKENIRVIQAQTGNRKDEVIPERIK